jgi:hypothetical protein
MKDKNTLKLNLKLELREEMAMLREAIERLVYEDKKELRKKFNEEFNLNSESFSNEVILHCLINKEIEVTTGNLYNFIEDRQ